MAKYEYLDVDSKIDKQTPKNFIKCFQESIHCENDTPENKYYYAYNAVIGNSLDVNLYMAFQIVDYVLMGAPGAVLKKALIDSGIAGDVFGSYDNGICQPYYSIVAKDAAADSAEKFMEVIEHTLQKTVREGLNKRSLENCSNYFEFRFREADFGRWPKGLMYGLQIFDSWLYDDTKPFIHLQAYATFEYLKKQIHTDYFEKIIDKYLLHNTHTSLLLILEPQKGLTIKQEAKVKAKLQAVKASMKDDEIERIIAKTKELRRFQETPSSQEELEKIPMISIEDIKKEAEPIINDTARCRRSEVVRHDIVTNGIGYVKLLFDLSCVPDSLTEFAGLLTNMLGNVDTEKYSYTALTDEVNMYTGGITTDIVIYNDGKDIENYYPKFVVVLERCLAMSLWHL